MRKRRWTDADLIDAVAQSVSLAQVLVRLGLRPVGGNYKTMGHHISRLEISTTHLLGQGWLRGSGQTTNPGRSLNEILVIDSDYVKTTALKGRLIRKGLLQYRCDICGISDWLGDKLVLHLDHKNGINNDSRLENLRLLCPNCHSQTETYTGRNIAMVRGRGVRQTQPALKFGD